MRYVVTAEEMRALDRATIETIGLPGVVLMENAGRAVALAVREVARGGHVAVVCGAGNNGGDGYVAARCLREWGQPATVYLTAAREVVKGDAALHLAVFERCGGEVVPLADQAALLSQAPVIEAAEVVVDALFGTGLARPIQGHLAAVIRVINGSRAYKVAVDVPSGLSSDAGHVLGIAVRANCTITFGFAKPGLVSAPGCAHAGRVEVAEMGVPRDLARAHGIGLALLEQTDVAAALPRRSALDHKSTRGHVLLVAGAPGKRGAGRMAARAALRAGAGLVTLAGPGAAESVPDEVMSAELDADAAGSIDTLMTLAEGKRCLAMGPGMPTGPGARHLVHVALARSPIPLVLDADGLNHLGTELDLVRTAASQVVLTPHPGEAARLLACSAADIERDRIASVRALAQKTGAVVVLKGARTLVCDGTGSDELTTINPTGNPGMATGGSGDVLTGVIAALVAQGVPPLDAARAGVYLHGRAGDMAAERGQSGLIAGDIIEALQPALGELEQGGTASH
jgi:ADP-dependent NAD(P)H-hydrate dehydratase / NAD(P)H-hydrate epimerase